jgi:hypothetical protein
VVERGGASGHDLPRRGYRHLGGRRAGPRHAAAAPEASATAIATTQLPSNTNCCHALSVCSLSGLAVGHGLSRQTRSQSVTESSPAIPTWKGCFPQYNSHTTFAAGEAIRDPCPLDLALVSNPTLTLPPNPTDSHKSTLCLTYVAHTPRRRLNELGVKSEAGPDVRRRWTPEPPAPPPASQGAAAIIGGGGGGGGGAVRRTEGRARASVDTYNARIGQWEPLVEAAAMQVRCCPAGDVIVSLLMVVFAERASGASHAHARRRVQT